MNRYYLSAIVLALLCLQANVGHASLLIGEAGISPSVVPEPSSIGLIAVGLGALAAFKRWKK